MLHCFQPRECLVYNLIHLPLNWNMSVEAGQWAAISEHLCENLGGDWLLTGGTLVRLLFDAGRGTEDIDLARVAHPELSPERALTELYLFLRTLGLGPEIVNAAVEPFVHEVPDWRGELVTIRQGARGRIFRPTLTLFSYLKLRRGTPIDLEDIRAAVRYCGAAEFDAGKFARWADAELAGRFARVRLQLGL
jgi:hypothetical protein